MTSRTMWNSQILLVITRTHCFFLLQIIRRNVLSTASANDTGAHVTIRSERMEEITSCS